VQKGLMVFDFGKRMVAQRKEREKEECCAFLTKPQRGAISVAMGAARGNELMNDSFQD